MVEALAIPWRRRKDFALALAVPLALLAGFQLGWYWVATGAREAVEGAAPFHWAMFFLCWAAFGALFTLFAVTCHRLVLLNVRPGGVAPGWSVREGRFLVFVISVWIVYLAVWWLTLSAVANLWPRFAGDLGESFQLIEAAAKMPALYVIARLSLVFPATAIDRGANLRWAWRASRGNGWRLVVVVTVLPWIVSHVFGLLYRDQPTPVEIGVLTLAGTALFAFEIAALSVAYRELTRDGENP